jgi:hypothetical protein
MDLEPDMTTVQRVDQATLTRLSREVDEWRQLARVTANRQAAVRYELRAQAAEDEARILSEYLADLPVSPPPEVEAQWKRDAGWPLDPVWWPWLDPPKCGPCCTRGAQRCAPSVPQADGPTIGGTPSTEGAA